MYSYALFTGECFFSLVQLQQSGSYYCYFSLGEKHP